MAKNQKQKLAKRVRKLKQEIEIEIENSEMLPTGNAGEVNTESQLKRCQNGESGRESRITLTIAFLWL